MSFNDPSASNGHGPTDQLSELRSSPLLPDGYQWEFLSTNGSFRDAGSGGCH